MSIVTAFGKFKRRLTSAPVLKFPEFKKPFKVHTDALDFAVGGVLMQEALQQQNGFLDL